MSYNAFAAHGAQNVDPRIAFWSDQKAWPRDTEKFVFVGRVILDLGKERFGGYWQDDDPAVPFVLPLSDTLNLLTDYPQLKRASDILMKHHLPYADRSRGGLLTPGPDMPSRSEWSIALEIDSGRYESELSRLSRFVSVCNRLLTHFSSGKGKTALRGYYGGDFRVQTPDFWNGEHANWRFDTCRVDPEKPFGPPGPFAGDGDWIFVERSTVYQLPEGEPEKQESQNEQRAVEEAVERRAKPKRGRPREYDWPAFRWEVHARLLRDGVPENHRAFAREMLTWCMNRWGKEPVESDVRKTIDEIVDAMPPDVGR